MNIDKLESCQDSAELKKTFRQLALQTHTDKGGNKDDFQELHRKYKELLQLMEENTSNDLLEATIKTSTKKTSNYCINVAKAASKMRRSQILYMLPLEVWMDILVFPWIGESPNWREENDKRKKLGPLVTEVGNRKFAEIMQFYLHDFGKVRLGSMDISMLATRSVEVHQQPCVPLSSHTTPTFHQCKPSYFHFASHEEILPTIAHRPDKYIMIRRIRALLLDEICLEFMQKHFPSHLARAKCVCLVGSPSLAIPFNKIVAMLLQWLHSGTEWDEPRFCVFHFQLFWSGGNHFKEFIATIVEQFLSATSSSTFAIVLKGRRNYMPDFHYENLHTLEQLHGRQIAFRDGIPFLTNMDYFEISRCKIGMEAKLGEWLKKEVNWHLAISMENRDEVNANFKWLNGPSYSTFEHSYIDVNIWHA